jgi:uncharacterized protein YkwD
MKVAAKVDRDDLALKLVARGVGVAIAPRSLATRDVAILSVPELHLSRNVGFIWRKACRRAPLPTSSTPPRRREGLDPGRQAYCPQKRRTMKLFLAILLSLVCAFSGLAAAEVSPAELISDFRAKHGEGHVSMDATLNRIALEQAKAMAAKDTLDHSVLGSFGSRIAPAKAGRAAENIAFGYDNFPKTLDQWIASAEHRKNLLLGNASRVGVGSARSATSNRTYWAMVIAGDYEPAPKAGSKTTPTATKRKPAAQSCHLKLLGICL